MKYIVLAGILILLLLLVKTRIRPSLIFFGLLAVFFALKLISAEDMLRHFVNPSVITLMLLLLVVSVLEKTDMLSVLSKFFFSPRSRIGSLFAITSISALLSAFINNTAVVASFIGPIKNNAKYSPSKFLIPLSYAAIVGGTITLIGTSTNLIVNGLVLDVGLPSLRIFDFIYVGLPITVAAVLYMTVFSSKLLPDGGLEKKAIKPNYFLEAQVLKGSSLIGKNLLDNRLRNLDNVFLAEIIRGEKLLSPVSPHEVIQEGDILVFTGDIANVAGLKWFEHLKIFEQKFDILKKNLVEVVVSHESFLIGQRIRDVNFRSQFDAAVVAVRRGDKRLSGKIGLIRLQPGDILVLAAGDDFEKIEGVMTNFYFTSPLKTIPKITGFKGLAAILLFIVAIIFSATGLIPLFSSLLAVLAFFVVFKFLDVSEMKRNFNEDILLLIGSALGISQVMVQTGAAGLITGAFMKAFQPYGLYGSFIGIYLISMILTQLITNNAAAALSFPLAYSVAVSAGVNPLPFIMATAYGASASFITPHGYQTNLLVYGAGRYKFTDYIKAGLPLLLIYSVLVIVLVPHFFKF